jgi:hypothetical protein
MRVGMMRQHDGVERKTIACSILGYVQLSVKKSISG